MHKKLISIIIFMVMIMPQEATALRPMATAIFSGKGDPLGAQSHNISSTQLDRVLDVAYALTHIVHAAAVSRADVDWLMSKEGAWPVCLGLSDITLVDNISPEECDKLRDILTIIDITTAASLDIIPLADNKAVVYEREGLRFAAMHGGMAAYPQRYSAKEIELIIFNCNLEFSIINDLCSGSGFFFDRMRVADEDQQHKQEAADIVLNILDRGQFIPRQTENTITDMAFPSARDADTLEKCMRSCLLSIRGFGYAYPAMWVLDDCTGDAALKKQAMIQRLATEFGVTINYAGRSEKDKFIDQLSRDPDIARSGLSRDDLVRIYFQPGKFGSNRNYVQLYCSGRIYATVDDDVEFRVTAERSISHSELLNRSGLRSIYAVVQIVENLKSAGLPAEVMEEITALTSRVAQEVTQQKKYSTTTIYLHKLLTILYAQKAQGNLLKSDAIIAKIITGLPSGSQELNSKGLVTGRKDFMQDIWRGDLDASTPTISLLVNAWGVHNRYIAQPVETLTAMRFQEIEGHGIALPQSSVGGEVGFVSSEFNLQGAGSSGNDIDKFVSAKDPNALEGERERHGRILGIKNSISDMYKLPTTTFTTVDNRASFGLLVPAMIDSHPLGMVIQRGDKRFKMFQSMVCLDHNRQVSATRNWEDDRVGRAERSALNEVDESALMTALRIHFGVLTKDGAIVEFVNEIFSLIGELRDVVREEKEKAARQPPKKQKQKGKKKRAMTQQASGEVKETALELISTICRRLGGIPFPKPDEMLRKKLGKERHRHSSHALRFGSPSFALPIKVTASSAELAAEYLSLPRVKEHIWALLQEYLDKIEEVERYSKSLHMATRQMRDTTALPFTAFMPEEKQTLAGGQAAALKIQPIGPVIPEAIDSAA